MAGIAGRRRGADIVAYACFPAKSLLLLVMAIYRRDRYTCVTKQKGGQSMEENVKNLCAPIPAGFTPGCGRSRRYPEKHWASIWPG